MNTERSRVYNKINQFLWGSMRDKYIRLIGMLIFLAYFILLGIVGEIFNVDANDIGESPVFLVFMFSAFIISLLSIVNISVRSIRCQNQNFQKISQNIGLKFIAAKNNFTFLQGFAKVEGKYLSHFIEIKKVVISSDMHTMIELSLYLNKNRDFKFIIAKKDRVFSGFGSKINSMDLENLESEFTVRSKNRAIVCRVLDIETQSRILKIKDKLSGNIELHNNKLVYTQGRELIQKDDVENFETIIRTMAFVADRIDSFDS